MLEFEDFSRAVRKDGKVTRSAMADRELRQVFDLVDKLNYGNISVSGRLCSQLESVRFVLSS